jgi:hypothetical protein
MSQRVFRACSLGLATLISLPAGASSDLSEADTNYRGAVMLSGEIDVDFLAHGMGAMNLGDEQTEYAYFSGNTLYVGAEDEYGNGVDGIVEFFWFESSIDRGSDFYVAVIKARTTPNVLDDWYLNTGSDPVLSVSAKTDISRGTGAFRWDWSVPFENYGMDSYGQVTMRSSYGIGAAAEGSAMAAEKYDEDGIKAEVSVQTKGHVDASYNVSTEYTITLWSWYTRLRGEPGEVTWDMTLDNDTLTDENAYHEYFLVMQADAGEPFTIDELQIGASVDEWWWGYWNQLSVNLYGLELSRPYFVPDDNEDDGNDDDDDDFLDDPVDLPEDDDNSNSDRDDDDSENPFDNYDNDGTSNEHFESGGGCSSVAGLGAGSGMVWLMSLLSLVGIRRRNQ